MCVSVIVGSVLLLVSLPGWAELNCNAAIKFHPDGGIESCTLNGHHTLHTAKGDRLVCMNGYQLVRYRDGRLESCTLLESQTFGDIKCDAQDRVEFDRDGSLVNCGRT